MPLLSLPNELLLDIVKKVDDFERRTRGIPDIVKLAHTCQLLRSLSITFIYTSVIVCDDRKSRKLHKLLTAYPHIATCVRKLTFYAVTNYSSSSLVLQPTLLESGWEILRSCNELRELHLKKSHEITPDGAWLNFNGEILGHVTPESRKSIETIIFQGLGLEAVLNNFNVLLDSREFSTLRTVKVEDCDGVILTENDKSRIEKYCLPAGDLRKLESVKNFYFQSQSPYPKVLGIGSHFAQAMPNIQFLSIVANVDWIYNTLSTYVGLGSHLIDLRLWVSRFNFARENDSTHHHELCELILELSQKLITLVIRGEYGLQACHELFTASSKWPQLTTLRIDLWKCKGIKPRILRDRLEKLTQTRPTISILMMQPGRTTIVSWNYPEMCGILSDDNYIAPLEIFEKLDSAYIDTETEESDEDFDDFEYPYEDFDYDLELDMEDSMDYLDFLDGDFLHGVEGGSGTSDREMLGSLGSNFCGFDVDDDFGW